MGRDNQPLIDPLFRVEHIRSTPNPQQAIWIAMHQDYCCDPVISPKELKKVPKTETDAGESIVRNLLAGDAGHWGPIEHVSIMLNLQYFNHRTIMQLRTHRIGVSYDVQSLRYTSQAILDVAHGDREVEDVFYVRPLGEYRDREGKRFVVDEEIRQVMYAAHLNDAIFYAKLIEERGFSEEAAAEILPMGVRQHAVASFNARSMAHVFDLRWKADAQIECQWFCDLAFEHFQTWVPNIANYYRGNRAHRARLSP